MTLFAICHAVSLFAPEFEPTALFGVVCCILSNGLFELCLRVCVQPLSRHMDRQLAAGLSLDCPAVLIALDAALRARGGLDAEGVFRVADSQDEMARGRAMVRGRQRSPSPRTCGVLLRI